MDFDSIPVTVKGIIKDTIYTRPKSTQFFCTLTVTPYSWLVTFFCVDNIFYYFILVKWESIWVRVDFKWKLCAGWNWVCLVKNDSNEFWYKW